MIGELPKGIPDNLIPYITQTAAGIRDELSVFGDNYNTNDGTAVRDYIHVEDLAIAHVSAKSHANGAKNPKAHLQKEVTEEQVLNAPMIAEPLGLFDCCGVSDGAAAAIVTTPEIAKSLGKDNIISVKALQLAVSNGLENQHNSWDGSYLSLIHISEPTRPY